MAREGRRIVMHFIVEIELDQPGKFCERRHSLSGVVTQYPVELQRPGHLPRSQIQLPTAQVRQTLGLSKKRFALGEFLLCSLSLADVAGDDGKSEQLALVIA